MSVLQSDTRPILERLAIGGEWWAFSPAERRQLAIWATMTSMVFDSSDPRTSAIEQAERSRFRVAKDVLPGWRVWIGRMRNGSFNRWQFRGGFGEGVNTRHETQTSVFGLGRVVMQTSSGRLDHPMDSLWAAQRMKLRVLWPEADPCLDTPPPGWTLKQGIEACERFHQLLVQPGQKRITMFYAAKGVVRHRDL